MRTASSILEEDLERRIEEILKGGEMPVVPLRTFEQFYYRVKQKSIQNWTYDEVRFALHLRAPELIGMRDQIKRDIIEDQIEEMRKFIAFNRPFIDRRLEEIESKGCLDRLRR